VDLPAGHLEVVVPARGPALRALVPDDVVGVDDLVVLVEVEERGRGALLAHRDDAARLALVVLRGLRHAVRLHLETNDAVALVLVRARVVLQAEAHMIVYVVVPVPLNADREPVDVHELSTVHLPDVPRRSGQVVDDPVHQVLVVNHAPKLVLVLCGQGLLAQDLA